MLPCCRCLVAGNKYDLQVVFRLCQLWFKHGTQGAVNAQLQTVLEQTPSYKFLCLSYQMASRLSSAAAGPLVSSGFQVCLWLANNAESNFGGYQTCCLRSGGCTCACALLVMAESHAYAVMAG